MRLVLLLLAALALLGCKNLTEQQAANLACYLANQEAHKRFGQQPFTVESYSVKMKNRKWVWGGIEPAGNTGFSAFVTFQRNGKNSMVDVMKTSRKSARAK